MTTLSLLVPFRDDGTRGRVADWLLHRWAQRLPEAQVIVAEDDGRDPFCKAMAVNRAAAQAAGDVLGILDADCWIRATHTRKAVNLIVSGKAPWVIPANRCYRLTREFTERLLAMDPGENIPPVFRDGREREGTVVAGLVLFPRAAWDLVGGMDERFRGWGSEDVSWLAILDTLWGRHVQLTHPLLHLWHPRARSDDRLPIWVGQTKRNSDLSRTYRRARGNPRAMAALCEEARQARHG